MTRRSADAALSNTERSRQHRLRQASGKLLLTIELTPETIKAAQALSRQTSPLSRAQLAQKLLECLRAQARAQAVVSRNPAGQGTWDDPLIKAAKPVSWQR